MASDERVQSLEDTLMIQLAQINSTLERIASALEAMARQA